MAAAPCLGFLASLGLALAGCAAPPPPADNAGEAGLNASVASAGAVVDPLAARDIISIFRRNNNLPPLTIDPVLQAAALEKARAMARADKASGGVSASGRSTVVSNVAAGYHTMADAFSGWRGSPQQKANMLNPAVRRLGIATAYAPGSKYKVFWALVLTE